MLYLGIDQSLSSPGIALLGNDGALLVADSLRVVELRGGERLSKIAAFISQTLRNAEQRLTLGAEGITACMEGPNLNAQNPQVLFDLGECAGAIKALLWEHCLLSPTIVAPTQLKKFATAKGTADKTEVLHAVKTFYGHDFGKKDDIADAYVLARIAYCITTEKFVRRCEADVVYTLKGTTVKTGRKPRVKVFRTENL